MEMVRESTKYANNRMRIIKRHIISRSFWPSGHSVSKGKRGLFFILVIADGFTKLTKIVPLDHFTQYDVTIAFTEHWVSKYGPRKMLQSDNGPRVVAKLFGKVYQILGMNTMFTTT